MTFKELRYLFDKRFEAELNGYPLILEDVWNWIEDNILYKPRTFELSTDPRDTTLVPRSDHPTKQVVGTLEIKDYTKRQRIKLSKYNFKTKTWDVLYDSEEER